MGERSLGGALLVVACLLIMACGLLDVPDHVRAYRSRNRIRSGMTLPTVFDELSSLGTTGDSLGLLAGFGCDFDGEKRTWVLSRSGPGHVVITYLEGKPFVGQSDWKELRFSGPAGVHDFLSEGASASCERYQANVGRWAFGLSLAPGSGKVREVGSLVYHAGD